MKRRVFRPKLSLEEAEKKFAGTYLDRSDYDLLVSDGTLGVLPSGEPKFLFLPGVLRHAQMTWERLRSLPFEQGRRFRSFHLQGSKGGELVMGWIEDVQPGSGQQIRFTRPTLTHPIEYGFLLMPLLGCVSGLLKDYLPEYWRKQEARAQRNGPRVIGAVWNNNTDHPLFSTATINNNLLFPAHADAKNESGLACLMAFGHFAGGDLCLPRLRVAFRLRPGDVLIADTNREQHGNIGPIAGERISVVGYLRDLSKGCARISKEC